MKKITIAIMLGLLGMIISTASVLAASVFQFSPASFNANLNKTITLKITLDPQGAKNYTAKAEISFPADILKVNSFTFGSNWMAVSQTGYDLTDNVNGILIKSAGYPGGISSPVTFGTISFTTKKEGSGTITVTGNSFILDAVNQNILSGTPAQASVIVKKAVVAPTTPTTQETPEEVVTPQQEATPTPVVVTTSEVNVIQTSFLASMVNILSLGTDEAWLGIIVTILLIISALVISQLIRKRSRKKI